MLIKNYNYAFFPGIDVENKRSTLGIADIKNSKII